MESMSGFLLSSNRWPVSGRTYTRGLSWGYGSLKTLCSLANTVLYVQSAYLLNESVTTNLLAIGNWLVVWGGGFKAAPLC